MKHSFTDAKTIYESESSIGKLLYSSIESDFVHLTISPNSKIESHTIELSITFFVVSGSGKINIDGTSFLLSSGDVISVKPLLVRSWENNSDNQLILLGVKSK